MRHGRFTNKAGRPRDHTYDSIGHDLILERQQRVLGWVFISPVIIFFLCFTVVPVLWTSWLSLNKYALNSPTNHFIGLDNYLWAFTREVFRESFVRTLYFSVLYVSVGTVLGLALAMLVNDIPRFQKLFRMVFFMPVITDVIAVSVIWLYLMQYRFGIFNAILTAIGLPRFGWLVQEGTVIPSLVLFTVWHQVGATMIIFLAGLQTVPQEMLDAAAVDGANRWQQIRHVKLPALAPVTWFVIITATIGALLVFGQVYVMTTGGPNDASRVLSYEIYSEAFQFMSLGRASAMAFIMFLLIFVITMAQVRISRRAV